MRCCRDILGEDEAEYIEQTKMDNKNECAGLHRMVDHNDVLVRILEHASQAKSFDLAPNSSNEHDKRKYKHYPAPTDLGQVKSERDREGF